MRTWHHRTPRDEEVDMAPAVQAFSQRVSVLILSHKVDTVCQRFATNWTPS